MRLCRPLTLTISPGTAPAVARSPARFTPSPVCAQVRK